VATFLQKSLMLLYVFGFARLPKTNPYMCPELVVKFHTEKCNCLPANAALQV